MKVKVIFVLALLLVVFIYFAGHYGAVVDNAYADNTKCEDGKDCYWAYHVDQDQKDQCRHNENKQWKFYDPLRPCGDDKPKEKDPTDTPKPVVVVSPPTATPEKKSDPPQDDPPEPTKTRKSEKDDPQKPTPTLTPTYITGESQNQMCDWCSLAETESAAQATQASAQSTIAAELSKGD